jgi:hypothetical protein
MTSPALRFPAGCDDGQILKIKQVAAYFACAIRTAFPSSTQLNAVAPQFTMFCKNIEDAGSHRAKTDNAKTKNCEHMTSAENG